jgi:hypothetical protein
VRKKAKVAYTAAATQELMTSLINSKPDEPAFSGNSSMNSPSETA